MIHFMHYTTDIIKSRSVSENRFFFKHRKSCVPNLLSRVYGNILAADEREEPFENTVCKNRNGANSDSAESHKL